MAVTRFEIHDFADVVEPGATIRAGQAAEVSIQTVPPGLRQRVVDFFSGVAVAGSATMTRLAPGVFLITPSSAAEAEDAPLLSLPRRRAQGGMDASALAHLNSSGGRERAFWPERRRA
jgi:cell division protein SepF